MYRFLALIALFALPAQAQAQDAPIDLSNRSALLFNMGGLFSTAPTSFDGIGVGGKMFTQPDMAFRFGVGLKFASVTDEIKSPGGNAESDSSTSGIALEGGVELVLARTKKAYLYSGGIAQVGYSSADPDGNDNDSTGYNITLAGILGANYFLLDGLSVGAEYRLGLSLESNSTEQGGDAERINSSLTLGVGSVGFHLGFWF